MSGRAWPHWGMQLAKREHFSRREEKQDAPVPTLYGETVRNRMVARRELGADRSLPGPM